MSSTHHRPGFVRFASMLGIAAGAACAGSAAANLDVSFQDSNGGFASTLNTASFEGPWSYSASAGRDGRGAWITTGQNSYIGYSCTSDLTSGAFTIGGTGDLGLSFTHRYSFEVDAGGLWDAGAVYISRNGGAWTLVDSSAFTSNGYNAVVSSWSQGSELGGQMAFTGTSAGYGTGAFLTSTANLGQFNAGDTLRVRFRAAYDSNTIAGSPSWAIDGMSLTGAVPAPGGLALIGVGLFATGRRRRA